LSHCQNLEGTIANTAKTQQKWTNKIKSNTMTTRDGIADQHFSLVTTFMLKWITKCRTALQGKKRRVTGDISVHNVLPREEFENDLDCTVQPSISFNKEHLCGLTDFYKSNQLPGRTQLQSVLPTISQASGLERPRSPTRHCGSLPKASALSD
jgi:hypothetical protein